MSDTPPDAVDWRRLREFAGVDLAGSYVLSWGLERETLLVDVDLLLTSEHPFYEKPRPAEKVCIRPAVIEFPYCESIVVDAAPANESLSATVERLQHGSIDTLWRHNDGPYEIRGEFGSVSIDAERPILRLRGP
ncbi:MAG: hypothetical protein R3288_05705 [Woeseiaceae bacterium]|nr:hypothetical protein [Woeseiaceae bacterium]